MRLSIAICDDERVEVDYLSKIVHEWVLSAELGAVISTYDSAEAFLFAYEEDKSFDILLLDIQMKNLDGISLAKKLRDSDDKIQIIFITGLPEFVAEGYEVSALHYLMKPVSKEKLYQVLNKALELHAKADESLIAPTSQGSVRLYYHEIQYIEATAHMTMVQTQSGTFEVKRSIGELETILSDGFCRVHRSCLVGLRHIRQINRNEIIMDSGKSIPLARRRYGAVNQAFIRYYKEEY